MIQEKWKEILSPSGNDEAAWDLFHENSKIGRFQPARSDQDVRAWTKALHESLPFEGYPVVELPRRLTPVRLSLKKAITTRVSVSTPKLTPCSLSLEKAATLLHYAYGVTRDNKGTPFPRPFRVVPSGGALYPLEIFFHSTQIESLQAGLYHYNPSKNHLRLLRVGDENQRISEALVQPEIAHGASLIIFITAIFERSIFKYGDRGYRFVLLEAGHVGQNICLVSTALGLACLPIGGFFDRRVDDYLGLDGITHSTIYMAAIGKKKT